MALSVLTALRFSAMTCVTPVIDMKGVVRPPCVLTVPLRCILQQHCAKACMDNTLCACQNERERVEEVNWPGVDLGRHSRRQKVGRRDITDLNPKKLHEAPMLDNVSIPDSALDVDYTVTMKTRLLRLLVTAPSIEVEGQPVKKP